MHGANIGGFDFTIRSPFRRLGVYPLGEDIPQYPASTIFLVLAQALPSLPLLPLLRVRQVLQLLQAPQVLPSPVPARALPLLQAHQPLRLLQVLPLLQVHQALRVLPSPPALEVGLIDCSPST
jgi:hypothetical protein